MVAAAAAAAAAAASQARVNAARAEIRQIVSYVTLHNVSYDSGTGVISSNEMKLYNSDIGGNFPAQPQAAAALADAASTAAGDARLNWTTLAPTSGSSQWNTEFALMWLAVFLAIPLLIGLLCCCLCVNRKEDSLNKALISKDTESGGGDSGAAASDSKKREDK